MVDQILNSDEENLNLFLEERARRNNFWANLKLLRVEYQKANSVFDPYEFEEWITDNYGIKLNFVGSNIGGDYTILDEKKYIIYLLKFQ